MEYVVDDGLNGGSELERRVHDLEMLMHNHTKTGGILLAEIRAVSLALSDLRSDWTQAHAETIQAIEMLIERRTPKEPTNA